MNTLLVNFDLASKDFVYYDRMINHLQENSLVVSPLLANSLLVVCQASPEEIMKVLQDFSLNDDRFLVTAVDNTTFLTHNLPSS